jgi:hypothetical protein
MTSELFALRSHNAAKKTFREHLFTFHSSPKAFFPTRRRWGEHPGMALQAAVIGKALHFDQ